MAVLEVTASKFRENLKGFFEIADTGKRIVIKRGQKQSYILTPVSQDDFVVTPALLRRIEKAEQEMREGKYTECLTYEDSLKHLPPIKKKPRATRAQGQSN